MDKSEFSHGFEKKIELPKNLETDIATKLFGSPYFWKMLYHGLLEFYKEDETVFAEKEFIKQGDKFKLDIFPKGSGKATYVVRDLQNTDQVKSLTIRSISFAQKSALTLAQTSFTYNTTTGKTPTLVIQYNCKASNDTPYNLMKMATDQMLKRIVHLALDPKVTIKELLLIGSLEFNYRPDKANYYSLPSELSTKLVIPKQIETIKQLLNKPDFLNTILPGFKEKKCFSKEVLTMGDKLTVDMNNMSREGLQLVPIVEQVNYTVKECGTTFKLLSQEEITNFHQLGFAITLTELSDDSTQATIALYYSKSTLISMVDTVSSFVSMFNVKFPVDPSKFLLVRARSLLDTTIRHLSEYINVKMGVEVELPLPDEREFKVNAFS